MFVANQTRKEVVAQYPSSAKIVKVEGGYMVFEYISDFTAWKSQK